MQLPAGWPRGDLCAVCERPCPDSGTIIVGASDGDEEMSLCPTCASMVFPGLDAAMESHCPICSARRSF